ncbi:MAG: hypothetical protein J6S51_06105 [Kiritimatiellae bacterium]|nr:hypothetical protein [Kiritimatiellia bacterium]
MKIGLIDLIVVAAFCALMVGVGAFYSRRTKSSDRYFGNDRTTSWWMSGIGFYMNSFSALGFVMYSALAYKFGWVAVSVCWMFSPAVALGARFLAVKWRRAALKSPIDYISIRYTPRMCSILALLGLPMQMADNAFKLLAVGAIVGVGTGLSPAAAIGLCGAVVAIYAACGGLRAILTCSVLQFAVILVLMLALLPLSLYKLASTAAEPTSWAQGLSNGFSTLIDKAPEGFFNFVNGQYTWLYLVIFFLTVTLTQSTNWSLVQRYCSTCSEKDARKAGYLVAFLQFAAPPLFFLPAMAGRLFLPEIPAAELNSTFAIVCANVLPRGFLVLMVIAMFASTMGAVSANVNAAASVIVNEMYVKARAASSAETRLRVAKVTTIIVSAIAVALALILSAMQGSDDLFNMTNKVFAIFLPPTAIPMVMGILNKRLSRRSGLAGLVGGASVGFVAYALGFAFPVFRQMVVMFPITSIATFIFLFLGTKLWPDTEDGSKTVAEFFRRMAGNKV